VETLRFRVLRDSLAVLYSVFVPPEHRSLLRFSPGTPPLAVGATLDGFPVGIALAAVSDEAADLVAVFVLPELRHRGIGHRLATMLAERARERGIRRIDCSYFDADQGAGGVGPFIESLGYGHPRPTFLNVRCTLRSVTGAPWRAVRRLGPRMGMIPWSAVERKARRTMESTDAASWIPADLHPRVFEARGTIHDATSVALLHDDALVGWSLTGQHDATLYFDSCFVHPRFQRLGALLTIVNESVDRASSLGFEEGAWVTPWHHADMVRFATRRLAPHATHFTTTLTSTLMLGPVS
jgi:GNAT superfamily N-acetyltransferase